ncbi:hypothetical protein [Soonwooa sp.]|uniref:hypothetical protein n=1 Tax=Soonwooa sp. TaxID=1938592 RepID=UPI00262DBC91|nr:hypothetical protein [Soonwooa sp.]
MSKNFKIYIGIFLVILVIMGIFQVNRKPILDWRKNFDPNSKSPFGLFVFNKEADQLFGGKLERLKESPYDYYSKEKNLDKHNILIIEKSFDTESWNKIFTQVKNGSNAMIIARKLPEKLEDSLKFRLFVNNSDDEYNLEFTDKKLQSDTLFINRLPDNKGFTKIDKNIEILGYNKTKGGGDDVYKNANFIKVKYGSGNFYLFAEPIAISNYYLLKSRSAYPAKIFSFLPQQKTLWFTETRSAGNSQSPMRFILANPPLRYALYIAVLGLVLFMIFNAKRKQRIVPIVEPLKNTSLEFVKSIGNLYLQEGDFHDMMAKKAQYFLHRIRLDLLIDTSNLDEDFTKKLQLKTGVKIETIQEAVSLIKKAQDPYSNVMKEDFIKMNSLLDDILK